MGKDGAGGGSYSDNNRTVVHSQQLDTIEILREQIKELHELIALKDKRIQELTPPKITISSEWQGNSNPIFPEHQKSKIYYSRCFELTCQGTGQCIGHYV